jgi:hypothetical protein
MRKATRATLPFLSILLLCAALVGCDKIKQMTGRGGGGDKATSESPTIGGPAKKAVKTPSLGVGSDEGDLFLNATGVPTKFKEKVGGPVRALELILYPQFAKMQAQDPKKKENVDEYEYRNGSVDDPAPVKLMGDSDQKTLEANLFSLDTVDFTAVPKMVQDATQRLNLEDGKVSHMILKRGLPFNKDVRWRVYVNGTRKNGSVEYDEKGNMKKVWN